MFARFLRVVAVALMAPLSTHARHPLDSAIAASLGEADLATMGCNHKAAYNVSTCLAAFGRYYGAVESMNSGWYGKVFKVWPRNTDIPPLVMKAIPFRQTHVLTRLTTALGGVRCLDEIKIARTLTERLEFPGISHAFTVGFASTLSL
jgi:hypothetical protein